MNEAVYDRVRALYMAALEMPRAERAEWLEAREAMTDVRAEVLELLEHSVDEALIRPSEAHRRVMESLPVFPMRPPAPTDMARRSNPLLRPDLG